MALRIRGVIFGVPALLCVSSASNVNLLKPEIAMKAGLPINKLERPFLLSFGVGSPSPVQYEVVSVSYQASTKKNKTGEHNDFIAHDDFYVTPDLTLKYIDGIVGTGWIFKYNMSWRFEDSIAVTDLAGQSCALESVPKSERDDSPGGSDFYIIAMRLE